MFFQLNNSTPMCNIFKWEHLKKNVQLTLSLVNIFQILLSMKTNLLIRRTSPSACANKKTDYMLNFADRSF